MPLLNRLTSRPRHDGRAPRPPRPLHDEGEEGAWVGCGMLPRFRTSEDMWICTSQARCALVHSHFRGTGAAGLLALVCVDGVGAGRRCHGGICCATPRRSRALSKARGVRGRQRVAPAPAPAPAPGTGGTAAIRNWAPLPRAPRAAITLLVPLGPARRPGPAGSAAVLRVAAERAAFVCVFAGRVTLRVRAREARRETDSRAEQSPDTAGDVRDD